MKPKQTAPRARFSLLYYLWGVGLILLLDALVFSSPQPSAIAYSDFLHRVTTDQVASVVITGDHIYGEMKAPAGAAEKSPAPPATVPKKHTPWRLRFTDLFSGVRGMESKIKTAEKAAAVKERRSFTVVPLPVPDPNLLKTLEAHGVTFRAEVESHWLGNFLDNWFLPLAVMIGIWAFIMRRMGQGPGALNVGKSKAKIYEADPNNTVRFSDVAGVDEAVEETREVVSFLKEPGRYTKLGAKLPKGVLLVGPPGTGKTLLARAVAGEAGVPFFSLSGSDFVEMFVGVGAARVRDLFVEAKKKAPCIIFIDELDAIGKSRAGQGAAIGGYDERENTLNQLLVEMDGFDGSVGVVIMAATNRPEVLDPALMRPGRFDRQILVDRPAREGRQAIFQVHTRKLALDSDVDLARLAGETPGFVGADIANLCNEAAIVASRRNHPRIAMADFQDAFERIVGGLEKKSSIVSQPERRIVAYHESGHTLIGYFTPGADPVQKVSIVPRGRGALGYTLQAPLEDRYLMSHDELLGRIRVLMGGRAAEQIVFGQISTGASDDIEKASRIARDMLTVYGMSRRLPNLSLSSGAAPGFLGQGPQTAPHSAEIEQLIGEEQLEILRRCYDEAQQFLTEKRELLETLAQRLLKQEKIDEHDLLEILGPRPVPSGG